jgi:hypothetical protein
MIATVAGRSDGSAVFTADAEAAGGCMATRFFGAGDALWAAVAAMGDGRAVPAARRAMMPTPATANPATAKVSHVPVCVGRGRRA